jgi:hypothetical protein
MGRTALISFAAFIAATCLGIDLWFVTARCSVSPPLYPTGIAIGAVAQTLAVSLPLLLARHFPDETSLFHLRCIGLGLFLAFTSVPVLRASVLFSDGIGKVKWYRSVGTACHGPVPSNGQAPNKRLERP